MRDLADAWRKRRPSGGLELLRKIRNPWLRLATIVGMLVVLVLVWRTPDIPQLAWGLSFALAVLFMPRPALGRRRSRRSWD